MTSATRQSKKKDPVRVVIVDDSALMRRVLQDIFDSDPDIEVVGVAPDAHAARTVIKATNPDVITLDVEMPKMDGIQFLRNIMRLRPTPVVMISTLTAKGADVALQALALGAIDVVGKPAGDLAGTIFSYADEIIEKIKIASQATVTAIDFAAREEAAEREVLKAEHSGGTPLPYSTTEQLIAIGGSTGGTEAIYEVVRKLPPNAPGTAIVQHIPKPFSGPFAERLNRGSAMSICEARDGQQILRGHAYVAPGDQHLSVYRDGARYHCRLTDSDPVNRHRPSVDVLFESVAKHVGPSAVGVILTGMGNDGAKGLLAMQEAGAPTVAQDKATSVVWGMPGSAVELKAVDAIVPLSGVAAKILSLIQTGQPS